MSFNHEHVGSTNAYGGHMLASAGVALALLDEVECGLIVCDGSGRVRVTNVSARRELNAARLLERNGDVLRRVPGVAGDLELAITAAALRHRRSMVRLRCNGDQLLVTVAPLVLPDAAGSHVLLMLGRREPCSDLALEMLASTYGLTLAERRVLSGLLREATPREIADEFGVALSTVRTQVASIRSKFGARSIEALLLRVAQVPPATGALRLARAAAEPAASAAWSAAA